MKFIIVVCRQLLAFVSFCSPGFFPFFAFRVYIVLWLNGFCFCHVTMLAGLFLFFRRRRRNQEINDKKKWIQKRRSLPANASDFIRRVCVCVFVRNSTKSASTKRILVPWFCSFFFFGWNSTNELDSSALSRNSFLFLSIYELTSSSFLDLKPKCCAICLVGVCIAVRTWKRITKKMAKKRSDGVRFHAK